MEFDFNAVPEKIFVDKVSLKIINGLLHVVFESGEAVDCFLMPLPLAKLMGKGILKQIEEIEQKNNITFADHLPDEPVLSSWTTEEGGKGSDTDQK